MQYPRQEAIDALNPIVAELLNKLRELESDDPSDDTEQNISYVVLSVLDQVYASDSTFRDQKDALGVLLTTALEFYNLK